MVVQIQRAYVRTFNETNREQVRNRGSWVKLGDTQYKYTRGSYADHHLECIVGIDGCKVVYYIDDYDAVFCQPFMWFVIWGSWLGLMLLWWLIRVIRDKCKCL